MFGDENMNSNEKMGGTWKIYNDNTAYHGELLMDPEKRSIVLELIITANKNSPIPSPPYKGKIPFICGTLFSGAKILLYDCDAVQEHTYVGQCTRQMIYANYAFWGLTVSSSDEIRFPQVVVDFGNIISWAKLCRYDWKSDEQGNYHLLWTHREPIKVTLNDNLQIYFCATQGTIDFNINDTQITAHQQIKVKFCYNNPTSWKTILDDIKNIQYLIGLGIGQYVGVASIEFCHESLVFESSGGSKNSTKVYNSKPAIIGTGLSRHVEQRRVIDYLYTLSQITSSNSIIEWCKKYDLLKPVLDLYFTASSGIASTPEILFLNLTQALETFHSRFITNNVTEYTQRVNEIVNNFCKGQNNSYWIDFLIDEGQKKNKKSIFLRTRLADLTFANGVLPFWPQAQRPDEFIRKVVHTRNYYTHYDAKKLVDSFTKEQLPYVNGYLIALLEYHILVLLGFDPNEVRKKTVQKTKQIDDFSLIHSKTHRTKQEIK